MIRHFFRWLWRWFRYYRKDDVLDGWTKRSEWWKENGDG